MICPKCGGKWVIKKMGFLGLFGPKRSVCKKCGYKDERMSWINDEYVGPPELYTKEEREKFEENKTMRNLFYKHHICPACYNKADFYEGPCGGMSINITCSNCDAVFNITPITKSIERIS